MKFELFVLLFYLFGVLYGSVGFYCLNLKFKKYLKNNYSKETIIELNKRIPSKKNDKIISIILICFPVLNYIAVTQTLFSYEKQKERNLRNIRRELFNMETE